MLSPQGGESPRFAGERGWKKQQVSYKILFFTSTLSPRLYQRYSLLISQLITLSWNASIARGMLKLDMEGVEIEY